MFLCSRCSCWRSARICSYAACCLRLGRCQQYATHWTHRRLPRQQQKMSTIPAEHVSPTLVLHNGVKNTLYTHELGLPAPTMPEVTPAQPARPIRFQVVSVALASVGGGGKGISFQGSAGDDMGGICSASALNGQKTLSCLFCSAQKQYNVMCSAAST